MGITEIRPPEEIPLLLESLRRAPERLDDAGIWRHRLRDGRVIHVTVASLPLTYLGRPAELVTAQDVTRLVELERARAARSAQLDRRLQDTLEAIADAFVLLDADWRFAFVNAEAARLLRRDKEALIGCCLWEEFPAAVGSDFERHYKEAVEHGRKVEFRAYYPPLEAWLEVNAYPADGGLAIYFRDVTRQLAQQEQLRLLETAVARLNDIVIITEGAPLDGPEGPRIVYVNEAFVRRTGFAREEAIGATPRILQGPLTQRPALDRIREALERRAPVRVELINYTKAGEAFWLDLDIVPLADGAGPPSHFVAVERDITERKQAEAAVRLSEERFRLVTRATNDVIWDWDLAADRIWWSENMSKVFGYGVTETALTTDSWTERIHEEDRARVERSFEEMLAGGGTTWSDEYRFHRADGSIATVADRGFVMRHADGTAFRVLGSMIDVTERHELDERLRQTQRLEAVGQLTGGVAHDFNNLLTVILGNAELLAEALESEARLEPLARMTASAAERGAQLTKRLLAFARRQALEPRAVDVGALLANMQGLLRRTLHENVEIAIRGERGLRPALVDPGQLEVAVLNLAINARDAMPEGGCLTIACRPAAAGEVAGWTAAPAAAADFLRLAVSDDGSGMPPEVAARAFEPFFTTKEVGKGSGLGLSMVYGFARQSGGHARILTAPDQGTTVELFLPCAEGAAVPEGRREPSAAAPGGREHVLVVEDDELVRTHAAAQLRGLGYRVSVAGSGPEALRLLDALWPVDLLFTDLVMPGGMNGQDLVREAARRHPALRCLYTSGYAEASSDLAAAGSLLLNKPYRRQDLAAKVREALEPAEA